MKVIAVVAALIGIVAADIFFQETFSDGDAWQKRWIQSTHKGEQAGKFVLSAGKFYGDAEKDLGIQTSEDARFYALSSKFKPTSNKDQPLVLQFTVKHEQNIDCGGGYAKVFDCSLPQDDMHGDSPYLIMFGPDICGPSNKKVHVIFNYKGKNHLIKKEIRPKDDVYTHLYTLIVNPDQTYEVLIITRKLNREILILTGISCQPKLSKIRKPRNQKTGMTAPKSTILKIPSLPTGTNLNTLPIRKPRNPKIGTMKWTANGSHP